MTQHARFIRERIENINRLTKLKKDVDPASGLAVAVRRGVVRDNEDDEHDLAKRPWLSIETSVHMQQILDLLIKEQTASLRYWVSGGAAYIKDLTDAVDQGRKFLNE